MDPFPFVIDSSRFQTYLSKKLIDQLFASSSIKEEAMRRAFCIIWVLILATAGLAHAKVVTQGVSYQHQDMTFTGYLAYDDAVQGKRPGVLVVHEWWGLDEYAQKRAEKLAAMGYVAFAADMYGEGRVTQHPKEASERSWGHMKQFLDEVLRTK